MTITIYVVLSMNATVMIVESVTISMLNGDEPSPDLTNLLQQVTNVFKGTVR